MNQFIKMVADAQAAYGPDSTKYWGSDHCNMVNPVDLPQAAKLHIYFSCQVNIGGAAFSSGSTAQRSNSHSLPR